MRMLIELIIFMRFATIILNKSIACAEAETSNGMWRNFLKRCFAIALANLAQCTFEGNLPKSK